jgi:hypothetical protein
MDHSLLVVVVGCSVENSTRPHVENEMTMLMTPLDHAMETPLITTLILNT